MDEQLRRLQRAAITGDAAAKSAYIKRLLQTGVINREAIKYASFLGYPPAKLLIPDDKTIWDNFAPQDFTPYAYGTASRRDAIFSVTLDRISRIGLERQTPKGVKAISEDLEVTGPAIVVRLLCCAFGVSFPNPDTHYYREMLQFYCDYAPADIYSRLLAMMGELADEGFDNLELEALHSLNRAMQYIFRDTQESFSHDEFIAHSSNLLEVCYRQEPSYERWVFCETAIRRQLVEWLFFQDPRCDAM